MDKIKRYIDCYIPTEACNLRCHYCYIAQKRKFNSKLARFSHSAEEIAARLSRDRLGGTCLLNLCAGGETLLSEDVLPLVKALLEEGHYVTIVTNGTITKRFQEIVQLEKILLKRLMIKFSFHFLELNRLGLMDVFFNNIRLMKAAGVSFSVEITPSDELIPFIEEVKETCIMQLGALCHVTIARDDRTNGIDILSDLSFDAYKETWGQFDSELFRFKSEIFYQKRNEFCYAGEWSCYLNLETGILSQCYCGSPLCNIYEDTNSIPFRAIGKKCSLPHCYNGHVFLTMGCIPEMQTPTYADVRNRMCRDGSEWLTSKMKDFLQSKLVESNKEYSIIKRICYPSLRNGTAKSAFHKIIHGLKRKHDV